MKSIDTSRSLEKILLAIIGVLLIFIGGVFVVRSLSGSANPELSPDQRITSTPTADGYTTVFMLADNAAAASTTYQEHLQETIAMLAIGVIGVIYAGVLLVYRAIFNLRFTRTPFIIAALAAVALLGGSVDQQLLNSKTKDVSNCAQLQSLYDSRQYKITEGIVHVSHQSSGRGHGDNGDTIQIGAISFEIEYFVVTCAYTNIIVFGSPLTEGTYARVYYTDYKTILRIDIKNP